MSSYTFDVSPHQYVNVHFHFDCKVSEKLYVQIRKGSTDNPPRALAPHNYFEKIDRGHHVYYGLDPAILAPIPVHPNNTPYFKVIDGGGEKGQYGIYTVSYDYHKMTIDIGNRRDVRVEWNEREVIFTIRKLYS